MNKLIKIIFVLSFLMPVFVQGQSVTWQKWYDYNNLEDNGQDVIQTFDGGYMILSNNYVPLNNSSVLTKTDKFGNVEWQRLYDRNVLSGSNSTCYAVTQCDDSGYVVSGDGVLGFIFRTDKLGLIQWVRKYSKIGYKAGLFRDHKKTSDGQIIATGRVYDPVAKAFVVKVDTAGNVLWDSVYNYTSIIYRITEDNRGNYYMLSPGTSVGSTLVAKTNSYGQEIWRANLYLPNAVDILYDSSDKIYVGGGLDSMFLYKLDTSGTVLFQKYYFPGVLGCASMCLSKEGNVLLAGLTNVNLAFLMAVSKVDSKGNLIFNRIISSLPVKGNRSFIPKAVNSTNDFGFIITGFTDYPPEYHESNIYTTKTDSVCNAPLIVGFTTHGDLLPNKFSLYQNYPNPFNGSTTISYDLRNTGHVLLQVIDVKGSLISTLIDRYQISGYHEVLLNIEEFNLASGIYFYKLKFSDESIVKKLVIIK